MTQTMGLSHCFATYYISLVLRYMYTFLPPKAHNLVSQEHGEVSYRQHAYRIR